MEVVKEFVVKGYANANFDTNLDDSEQQIGFVQQSSYLEQLQVARGSYILQDDIEICKAHTDLNVADPLTKTSLVSIT